MGTIMLFPIPILARLKTEAVKRGNKIYRDHHWMTKYL